MRATDDSGKVLNAEFFVEEDAGHLALVLNSAGGPTPSGIPRNADYRSVLTLLLDRLREREAVLLDALVDSSHTRRLGIPERDRRLIASPVQLAELGAIEDLRVQLTSAQGRIGQAPAARKAGNNSKRIRLILDVPGYRPSDAGRLEIDLAAPRTVPTLSDFAELVVPNPPSIADWAAGRVRADTRQPPPALTADDVLEVLDRLQMQKGPDGLAKRHQPLTLLWAIGRARQRKGPLAPWPVARSEIGELIRRFGRETDASNPYLPFLALNSTGLWKLTASPPRKGTGPDPRRRWLNNTKPPVAGGLAQDVYDLMTETEAAANVVATLLDTYFTGVDQDSLLQATELHDLTEALTPQPESDADEADDPRKEDRQAAEALLQALASGSKVVDAEANHADSTQYTREARTVIVQRGESQLVARYRQTLSGPAKRLRLPVGLTDLYLVEEADLIEAKVSAKHRYVREALGQLLDYAAHCTLPVNRLTALFPNPPTQSDIQLLHTYGIDCLYWAGDDKFVRLEAPAEARQRIAVAWNRDGTGAGARESKLAL
jgi:hypothetical protein